MKLNNITINLHPDTWHHAVLNKMNDVAESKRSLFAKACQLYPLSGAALITSIASTAAETFTLLGKLALAGVKYGAIGSIRVFTWTDAFDPPYRKMPDGKSLSKTTIKVGMKSLGIFYSLLGLAHPTFNLRRQEELGNFVKKRKAGPAEPPPVPLEAPKKIEPKVQEAAVVQEPEKALKERKVRFLPIAKQMAAVARGVKAKERKAKEAQKLLGRQIALQAAAQARQPSAKLLAKKKHVVFNLDKNELFNFKQNAAISPELSTTQHKTPNQEQIKAPKKLKETLKETQSSSQILSKVQDNLDTILTTGAIIGSKLLHPNFGTELISSPNTKILTNATLSTAPQSF